MKFNTFKEIVHQFATAREVQDTFTDSLPSSLTSFMYENEFYEAQGQLTDFLTDLIFKNYEDLKEEMYWFAWEWTPGATVSIPSDEDGGGDIVYTINNDEDFFNYILDNYEFNE